LDSLVPVTFRYFAYGSNLWLPQIRSRCPSAKVIGPATLEGWSVVCDKPSQDGSAKLNIRADPSGTAHGVIYEIDEGDRQALDAFEPEYAPIVVEVDGSPVMTYIYEGDPHSHPPYDWYVAMARSGALSHGLADLQLTAEALPDPMASGVRSASRDDVVFVQSILSEGLAAQTDRYYIHPGDYAWWVYHDDPRYPDALSAWIQNDSGFVTIDSGGPHENEITVFTLPGVDRMPLIRWAQRRLRDKGAVGWISDDDRELIVELEADGYEPDDVNRSYQWDLTGELPKQHLPAGWALRAVTGEPEADSRRAASHGAFESTMPSALHLQRYLDFMRSPVYVPEHDLVAVSPSGEIASFMVWWGDESGVAQIEPFGTHPDYQRQGVGRALIYHGLEEMRAAGMHTCRVVTDEPREATAFYTGVGFTDVGRIRWWRKY
jgi:ribosomal protein S18 acetylase RimI-like enzyme